MAIQYDYRWVLVIAPLILLVGILTLFVENVAVPLLNTISGIAGSLAVGLILL